MLLEVAISNKQSGIPGSQIHTIDKDISEIEYLTCGVMNLLGSQIPKFEAPIFATGQYFMRSNAQNSCNCFGVSQNSIERLKIDRIN